jgi:hypothetical protein
MLAEREIIYGGELGEGLLQRMGSGGLIQVVGRLGETRHAIWM